MNHAITSSMVICEAMGIIPDGVPAKQNGPCAFCGTHIATGNPSTPFTVTPAFMDDLSLAAKGSGMTCGYCTQLLSAETLRNTGYGAFSISDGVLPFRKRIDIGKALLNPPKPPFVMTYATANNQHMAWRAPVNHSRDMFYARVGLRDLKIRRDRLIAAIGECEKVALDIGRKHKEGAKILNNPFPSLDWALKDGNHANLTPLLIRLHSDPKLKGLMQDDSFIESLNRLMGLTLGETWGLFSVLHPDLQGAENDNQ